MTEILPTSRTYRELVETVEHDGRTFHVRRSNGCCSWCCEERVWAGKVGSSYSHYSSRWYSSRCGIDGIKNADKLFRGLGRLSEEEAGVVLKGRREWEREEARRLGEVLDGR